MTKKARTGITIEVPHHPKFPLQYRVCLVREPGSQYGAAIDLSSPESVYRISWDVLQHTMKEKFIVLALNTKNKLIAVIEISEGDLSSSIVHPREVFQPLILLGGVSAWIAVHNHPSGDPTPSQRDVEITQRLRQSSELLGIKMLDHVVVAEQGYYSFQTHGFFASSSLAF